MTYDLQTEIIEAIRAGETAIYSLNEARTYLSKASGWGVVDILGGGFFTNLMKHSNINEAYQYMDDAKNAIRNFSKELDDIDEYLPDIKIDEFLTFADFIFDGFFADVFVQSKINEACNQVDEAISQVTAIINRLKKEV